MSTQIKSASAKGAVEANKEFESIIPSHCPVCEVLSADIQDSQQRLADEIMARELSGKIMGKVAVATSTAADLKTLMILDSYITKSIELSGVEPCG